MEAASNSTLCSVLISAVLPSHLSEHGAQDSHGRGEAAAAEKTLAAEGHSALAAQVRTALHDGMRSEAVAAIEAITGKRVSAYLTEHRDDRDLAVIAFHLDDLDLNGP